jgi:hypothetical protein
VRILAVSTCGGSRSAYGSCGVTREALAAARGAFEEALDDGSDDPEALDGLGRDDWWLREPHKAVVLSRAQVRPAVGGLT